MSSQPSITMSHRLCRYMSRDVHMIFSHHVSCMFCGHVSRGLDNRPAV